MTAVVIAFANQSGGCGKSTGCTSIADVCGQLLAAGETDDRILVIDLDLQGDASTVLGISDPDHTCGLCGEVFAEGERCESGVPHEAIANAADVLMGIATIEEAITTTKLDRVDLVPASIRLAAGERNLSGHSNANLRLRETIGWALARYKVILIDSPASLGVVAVNIFVVSDHVIACVKPGLKEIRGLVGLEITMDQVNAQINAAFGRHVGLSAVLISDIPSGNAGLVYQEAANYAREQFGDLVLPEIRRDVRVAESYSHQIPVVSYDAKGRAAKDFKAAVAALIERGVLPAMGPPPKPKRAPRAPKVIPAESPAA